VCETSLEAWDLRFKGGGGGEKIFFFFFFFLTGGSADLI